MMMPQERVFEINKVIWKTKKKYSCPNFNTKRVQNNDVISG